MNRPDETSAPLLPFAVWLPLLLALLACSLSDAVQAGERRARLSVELQLEGGSQWQDHGDSANTRIRRHYRLVTTLRSDGELLNVNDNAPDHARRMMERSQRVQARVAATAAPPVAAPSPAALMAQAAQLQALQKRCGNDQACLMRALVPQAAARVSADPAVQARLVRGLEQRAAAGHHDYTEDAEQDAPRYLRYVAAQRCDARLEVRAEETSEGQYADVHGPVPWRELRVADAGLAEDELRLMCLGFNLILDTKDQTLCSAAGFVLPEPPARTTRTERGRTQRSEARLAPLAPVVRWVADRTRQAPRSGSATTTLPLALPAFQGRGASEGTVRVQLRWTFEDL